MSRSLTTRALALGLIALFHVAMFQDVVMLLRMPLTGVEQVASALPAAPDHASMAGHEHHGASHASTDSGDPDPAPNHDHGSCSSYCCSHSPAEVGRLPTLRASVEAPSLPVAAVEFVELYLSPTVQHNTLPIPPPVA
jgi:hypothetical protein